MIKKNFKKRSSKSFKLFSKFSLTYEQESSLNNSKIKLNDWINLKIFLIVSKQSTQSRLNLFYFIDIRLMRNCQKKKSTKPFVKYTTIFFRNKHDELENEISFLISTETIL